MQICCKALIILTKRIFFQTIFSDITGIEVEADYVLYETHECLCFCFLFQLSPLFNWYKCIVKACTCIEDCHWFLIMFFCGRRSLIFVLNWLISLLSLVFTLVLSAMFSSQECLDWFLNSIILTLTFDWCKTSCKRKLIS